MFTLTDHLESLSDPSSAHESREDSWITVSEAATKAGILHRNGPIGVDVVVACQRAMDTGQQLQSDGPLREHASWAFDCAIPTVRDCARTRAGESDGWPLARECAAWLIRLCNEGPLNLHGFGNRLHAEYQQAYASAPRARPRVPQCVSCARPRSRSADGR